MKYIDFIQFYDILSLKDVLGCDSMRFIGCKNNLLTHIDSVINENTSYNRNAVFCDIFSGTGAVARYFKDKYTVYSNDSLFFSFVLQKAMVENNITPSFEKLKSIGILDPFAFLEETRIITFDYSNPKYFIANNYSPHDDCNRMYFTNKNAVRIDFIRNTIEAWRSQKLLEEHEYYYLLASLIDSVPSVSNTTGTYGAYLKTWDKRSFKDLELSRFEVFDNKKANRSFNRDSLELIEELSGDIIYIDPPYNERQYAPNYHILETIAQYDYPQISGVTGMRPYQNQKSPFCVKSKVADAFEQLISKADFNNIVLSYSTDGILPTEQIEEILTKHCIGSTLKRYDIPYRSYKSKIDNRQHTLYENLFFIKKHEEKQYTFFNESTIDSVTNKKTKAAKKKFIKSPTNYIGGKYKLLGQLLPLFPKNINTFVDLFAGGCNVGINVNADKIIFNDINSIIIDLFKYFQETPINELLNQIDDIMEKYSLSKTNEEGFKQLREEYNQTRRLVDLYTLSCYSFNYQFRFNNNHEYNNPFGRNRSQFSKNMRENLIAFVDKLQNSNVEFTEFDFEEFDIAQLGYGDFVYCDPPYLITTGSYNDGNRGFKNWSEKEEKALYDFLDRLNDRGVRFALSNVLEHKGKTNAMLHKWAAKYRVIEIKSNYSNSSYNTANGSSREVLIVNY